MIERARFVTREKQKEFFLLNKGKLNIGNRKLAILLNSTRGAIESYTAGRTAPPIDIIKRLELITGVKSDYEKVIDKVVRNKRKLMPMPLEEANKILKNKFKNNYENVKKLINQRIKINEITNMMRKQYNYKFDNSAVYRAIGTLRKYLQIRIVKKIGIPHDSVIIKGYVKPTKNSFTVFFSLKPLVNVLKERKIEVGIEISEDMKNIRLFPLENIGRKIAFSKNILRIILPSVLGFEPKHKLNIIYSPQEFNQNYLDFIQDKDGRAIATIAKDFGFEIYPFRNTNNTNSGDLTLKIQDKLIMIEITRAKTTNIARFKIGQCLVQKIASNVSTFHFIVCRNNTFSKDGLNALKYIGVNIIYTEFGKNWAEYVLHKIKEKVKLNGISNF